jgi:hypothetical protein
MTNETKGGLFMTEEKRKRGPKGGRDRFQLVIPTDVLEEAKELADSENRSVSNMLATLVSEAIKARKEKKDRGPVAPAPLVVPATA